MPSALNLTETRKKKCPGNGPHYYLVNNSGHRLGQDWCRPAPHELKGITRGNDSTVRNRLINISLKALISIGENHQLVSDVDPKTVPFLYEIYLKELFFCNSVCMMYNAHYGHKFIFPV